MLGCWPLLRGTRTDRKKPRVAAARIEIAAPAGLTAKDIPLRKIEVTKAPALRCPRVGVDGSLLCPTLGKLAVERCRPAPSAPTARLVRYSSRPGPGAPQDIVPGPAHRATSEGYYRR